MITSRTKGPAKHYQDEDEDDAHDNIEQGGAVDGNEESMHAEEAPESGIFFFSIFTIACHALRYNTPFCGTCLMLCWMHRFSGTDPKRVASVQSGCAKSNADAVCRCERHKGKAWFT